MRGRVICLTPPSSPPHTVKPRKLYKVKMPIAVCDATGNVWFEKETGMRNAQWDLIEFISYLRDNWPSLDKGKKRVGIMMVCHNPHKVFHTVHRVFGDDPEWNARFSVTAPDKFHRDGEIREPKVRATRDIRIAFFGFRDENKHTKYFHLISPFDFMDDFNAYGNRDWPEYIRLYEWGGSVRRWVGEHGLRLAPSRGGLAAQLLRDKKFYSYTRRKAPTLTNEKARPAMPGNFYAMTEPNIQRLFSSVYVIDQQNAHHYAAETVPLPDVNTLFAHGRFLTTSDKPYARENTHRFTELLKQYGLFRVRLWVPKGLVGMLPPWAMKAGLVNAYLYSNELDMCRKLGIEIRGISHAWTSPNLDVGLAKYAHWAQSEVAKNPRQKPWLKPVLLSAYGVLGSRPRKIEMAYAKSKGGEPHQYLLGPYPVTMKRVRTKKPIQSAIANTIHRGMIEAETRRLSIELARELEQSNNVIAIHADAVLVEDKGQTIPLLSKPWRVKDRLKGFTALDRVSYQSDTVTVLPGRKRKNAASR